MLKASTKRENFSLFDWNGGADKRIRMRNDECLTVESIYTKAMWIVTAAGRFGDGLSYSALQERTM